MHVEYFIFTTELVFFTECLTLDEGIFALVKNFTSVTFSKHFISKDFFYRVLFWYSSKNLSSIKSARKRKSLSKKYEK